MLEAVPFRRHPVRHPRPPARRLYGGWPVPVPVFYEPQVIEIERTTPEPAMLWRVAETSSWGQTTLMQARHIEPALKFFNEKNWGPRPPFNLELELQRWTSVGWKTVKRKNSSEHLWHSRR